MTRSVYFGRHLDSLWDRPDGSMVCSGSGSWEEFLPELRDPASFPKHYIHMRSPSSSSSPTITGDSVTTSTTVQVPAGGSACKCEVCSARSSNTHLRFFYAAASHRSKHPEPSMLSFQQLRALGDLPPPDANELSAFAQRIHARALTTSKPVTDPAYAAADAVGLTDLTSARPSVTEFSGLLTIETETLPVSSASLRLPPLSHSPIVTREQAIVSPFAAFHANRLQSKGKGHWVGRPPVSTRSGQSYADDPLEFCDASEAFSVTTGRSYGTSERRSSRLTGTTGGTDFIIEDDGSVSIEEMLRALEIGELQAEEPVAVQGVELASESMNMSDLGAAAVTNNGAVIFRNESSWNSSVIQNDELSPYSRFGPAGSRSPVKIVMCTPL